MTDYLKVHDIADDIVGLMLRPPRRRGVECITIADNVVKCRGEPLDAIWWRGKQWAVTAHGIECLDGTYHFDRSRLLEDLPEWSWPQHMAEKIWVDVDDFATAWLVGLVLHGYGDRIDAKVIREMFGRLPPRRQAAEE